MTPQTGPGGEQLRRVKWLRAHAAPIRTRSRKDDDFSDLEPLRRIVGDAQVVALGEQSHCEGKTFTTKVRLVKFLHQRMGFSVLAWESGLWACDKSWHGFLRGEPPIDAASKGVFGVWSGSAQVQPVFDYVAASLKSSTPLEIAGFDSQTVTGWGRSRDLHRTAARLTKDVRSLLAAVGISLDSDTVRDALVAIRRLATPKYAPQLNTQDAAAIQRLATLVAKVKHVDKAFWVQVLQSMVEDVKTQFAYKSEAEEAVHWASTNARDPQMARNLAWLANHHFRNRRIIVWAATAHTIRDASSIETRRQDFSYEKLTTMGTVADRLLGQRYRTIGFVAHHGRAGRPGLRGWTVKPSTTGSIEDLLERAGFDNAILDLRHIPRGGSWLRQPLIARPLGNSEMRADWTKPLDALVFNRVMTPSTLGALPSRAT